MLRVHHSSPTYGMAQTMHDEQEKPANARKSRGGLGGFSHLCGLDAFLPAFLGVYVDIVRLQLFVVTRAGLGRVQL